MFLSFLLSEGSPHDRDPGGHCEQTRWKSKRDEAYFNQRSFRVSLKESRRKAINIEKLPLGFLGNDISVMVEVFEVVIVLVETYWVFFFFFFLHIMLQEMSSPQMQFSIEFDLCVRASCGAHYLHNMWGKEKIYTYVLFFGPKSDQTSQNTVYFEKSSS